MGRTPSSQFFKKGLGTGAKWVLRKHSPAPPSQPGRTPVCGLPVAISQCLLTELTHECVGGGGLPLSGALHPHLLHWPRRGACPCAPRGPHAPALLGPARQAWLPCTPPGPAAPLRASAGGLLRQVRGAPGHLRVAYAALFQDSLHRASGAESSLFRTSKAMLLSPTPCVVAAKSSASQIPGSSQGTWAALWKL